MKDGGVVPVHAGRDWPVHAGPDWPVHAGPDWPVHAGRDWPACAGRTWPVRAGRDWRARAVRNPAPQSKAHIPRSLVWFVALLILQGCAEKSTRCTLSRAADLPLYNGASHIYTNVVLNGVPVRMLVDTGATVTVVSRATADRLGLDLAASGRAAGVGGAVESFAFTTRSFQIGRLHGTRFPLQVSDLAIPIGKDSAEGLLGVDFLSSYDVDLDLPRRTATLFAATGDCTAPSTTLEGRLYQAKLVRPRNPHDFRPMVHVTIGGKTKLALIDTGAPVTALFRNAAHDLGLPDSAFAAAPRLVAGGIGPRRIAAARFIAPPMTVGELTVAHMPVAVLDQESGEDGVDMFLGLDFLRRVHGWFSFSSDTLIMQVAPPIAP
jgi:predicted aspartyl protease